MRHIKDYLFSTLAIEPSFPQALSPSWLLRYASGISPTSTLPCAPLGFMALPYLTSIGDDFLKSCWRESNSRPLEYKANALPTELQQQLLNLSRLPPFRSWRKVVVSEIRLMSNQASLGKFWCLSCMASIQVFANLGSPFKM